MADEIRQYTATIPANTPSTAPVTTAMTMPPREVIRVEIIVPPGVSGLVGFALQMSGVTVIPYQSDKWIVTADEKIVWDLQGYPDSGDWQLIGYNTGTLDHSIMVRFLLNVPQRGHVASSPLISVDQLQAGATIDAAPDESENVT